VIVNLSSRYQSVTPWRSYLLRDWPMSPNGGTGARRTKRLTAGTLHRARRIRHWLPTRLRCRSAEVRILTFARGHELRVDFWQRLRGPGPLGCACHNRSDAIHYDPKAHIGPVGNKSSL
jgi:hypothetical protein